jgi:hypothetical protein
MARRTGGKERAVCGKPVEAIQALAERKRENGDTARVRFRVRTWGEDGVIRHPSGIPTFLARSAGERLVLVQVRRAFLQVHRPSIRVGSETDVVYSTNGTHGPKAKCYALLRMRPLSISWAECSVVMSCAKVDYDKSG